MFFEKKEQKEEEKDDKPLVCYPKAELKEGGWIGEKKEEEKKEKE